MPNHSLLGHCSTVDTKINFISIAECIVRVVLLYQRNLYQDITIFKQIVEKSKLKLFVELLI